MINSELSTDLKLFLDENQIENKEGRTNKLGNNGRLAVYPKSEGEISKIIKYADENGRQIIICGKGTKSGFGGLVDTSDILLSLEKYSGLIEHQVGDMTVTVKAGTKFTHLQKELAKYGQMIPLDPSYPDDATIGGVIAANDSGPKRLGYGSARDLVIGMKIICADGSINHFGGKVVKNVAGYDMNKLFVGSMGTLGVITEVTLKLRPIPNYQCIILLSFPNGNLDEIRNFAVTLLDSMMEPITLEMINPSMSQQLFGHACYTLMICFEDVESSVHYQVDFVKEIKPINTKFTTLTQADATEFWGRFNKLVPNSETEAVLKIGVKNLDVLQVMREIQIIADKRNVFIQSHGGLGHGICQVYVKGSEVDVIKTIQEVRQFTEQLKGYVIVKHSHLGIRRVVDVWGDKPPYFFILQGIKNKMDPNKTLNDKRYVGGL